MNDQIEELIKKVEESNSPRVYYKMELENIITDKPTNKLCSSQEDLKKAIGDDLYTTLSTLDKHYRWPSNDIYDKIKMWKEGTAINLKGDLIIWLKENKLLCDTYEIMISLLEAWITNYRTNAVIVSIEKIRAFEEYVASLHEWSLTKVGGTHVIRLFNDGEINTTKSGECYGDRSVFTTHSTLLVYPQVKFPVNANHHDEKYSYVVLPSINLAVELRTQMKNMMTL